MEAIIVITYAHMPSSLTEIFWVVISVNKIIIQELTLYVCRGNGGRQRVQHVRRRFCGGKPGTFKGLNKCSAVGVQRLKGVRNMVSFAFIALYAEHHSIV